MPDVAALRKRLPLVLHTPAWSCCGTRGIRIVEALGHSQWALRAVCRTCNGKLMIWKRGVYKRKDK